MISNDHIVGFLAGILYLGIIVIITVILDRDQEASGNVSKGYTEHWKLEDQ